MVNEGFPCNHHLAKTIVNDRNKFVVQSYKAGSAIDKIKSSRSSEQAIGWFGNLTRAVNDAMTLRVDDLTKQVKKLPYKI